MQHSDIIRMHLNKQEVVNVMNKCTERVYNGLVKRKSYLRSDVRNVSDPGGNNILLLTV